MRRINMKQTVKKIMLALLLKLAVFATFTGCTNSFSGMPNDFGGSQPGGFGQVVEIVDDGSTTDYVDTTTAEASCVVADDLYENFIADGTVYISFNGTDVTAKLNDGSEVAVGMEESSLGKVSDTKITIVKSVNVEASTDSDGNEIDEASNGIVIQYKGTGKIKYVLSGTYTGTVFIKNKKADAAVILNGVNITSDSGAGPVLRFSSEKRTFIVVADDTENTLTDTRVLNQSSTMYDDKKGSVYSKGAIIFTGETADSDGGSGESGTAGTLNIINSGYKHAVYAKDYVRIADGIVLNVTVDSTTGRDCIRALNAVIVDGGDINLTGKGTIEDDESVGIKVEGEDADEDDLTVEYTNGAGFVIINGGKLTINTVAKGITAHWKSASSVIGDSNYTATANKSLLCGNYLNGTTATTPNPFVEINGGIISIKTTGEPYEGRTDSDPSCSPEGIEAKADLTINAGTITLSCTDDAMNAGGNITINGGAIYAYSRSNDAIDSNGTNGITINGGVVVALGLNTPECAFDCDQNPFKINGGLVVGLGTSNYTAPTSGNQSTVVLGSSSYGNANTTVAVVDENGNPVFVYTLPAATGEVMVLSSPNLATGSTYTVKTGVTVTGGVRFHNLYTTLPTVSGGTSSLCDVSTTSSNKVYTDSSAGSGFGAGGMGGPGGMQGGAPGTTERSWRP